MTFAPYFSLEEYEARWEGAHEALVKLNCTMGIVWARGSATYDRFADVYYLTNHYTCSAGQLTDSGPFNGRGLCAVVLRLDEKPEVVSDRPPIASLLATDRYTFGQDVIAAVANAIDLNAEARVALIGSDLLPAKYFRQLQTARPGITWVESDDLVHMLRLRKSPAELKCMRRAGEIATSGLTRLIEGLIRSESQATAASAAIAQVMRRGGRVFQVLCDHGLATNQIISNPLTGFNCEAPATGDLVRGFLWGPFFQGYGMDPGRTAICGKKPTPEQREFLEKGVREHRMLLAAVQAGMTVGEFGDLGDDICGVNPKGSDFQHRLSTYGHGQGLYVERPELSRHLVDADMVLQPNMTMSIESFVQHEHFGTAFWEQPFILHSNGIEELVSTPLEWW